MTRFWTTHAVLPAAAWLLAMLLIVGFDLDRLIAHALFFDGHWIGRHTAWAETWIHDGGRDLVRLVAAGALGLVMAGYVSERWRPWRRDASFVVLAIVLSTGVVGLLKHLTNVDCPWNLAGFGGNNPYVPLLAARPENLPPAACFPGAHSSSGFALMCFYFVLRGRAAKAALAAGLAIGLAFAFAQEARGAHFLSHDLTSVAVVWAIQLALFRRMLQHGSERAIDPALQDRLTS